MQDVNISSSLGTLLLTRPLIINAITGGDPVLTECNALLADIAANAGIAMAVGSQYGAVRSGRECDRQSFRIVRERNPHGIILANLNTAASLEEIKQAVDMIAADGLQIHLNSAQELIMPEGERDFRGKLEKIALFAEDLRLPLIIKETGSGIARKQADSLFANGVRIFDTGGAGGTNFLAVEAARNDKFLFPELLSWGLPTALSVLETNTAVGARGGMIIAAGGLRTGLDAAKALALGASAVSMAGNILKTSLHYGAEQAIEQIAIICLELQKVMVLCGAAKISDLHRTPLIFTDNMWQALSCLGYDLPAVSKSRR